MSGIGIVSITTGSEATTSRALRLGGLSYPTRGLHLTPAVYALPIQGKAVFGTNRADVAVQSFENRVMVGRVCRVGNGDRDE